MSADEAFSALSWHYENRSAVALEQHNLGVPVVGMTSNTVPWELIRAAGFFPVLLSAAAGPTPLADHFMEPVFDSRIRGVFDKALAGDWSFLKLLVIPRTSEPEYKLYLYLSEVARQQPQTRLPPVYLYDLLHTRSVSSRNYGRERTVHLKRHLEEVAGRAITAAGLQAAVEESNAARRAIRRLLKLRATAKLTGVEAMAAIGAHYFMDRRRFATLAQTFAASVAKRRPLGGPRLLIKGFPIDNLQVHRALESHGAVVVAEDDWWGSRAAGRDVSFDLFSKYYSDAPSPRVFPPAVADRWFEREAVRGIDGVVFYLPPDDDVYGWDYPRQRKFLDARGIPGLLIRGDCHQGIESFVKALGHAA